MKIDKTIEVKLVDNSGIIRKAFEKCEDAILEALGVQGSDNVRQKITEAGAVDTGLMRNSIAWAVSGQQPTISYLSSGKHQRTYKPGTTHEKTGKPVTAEEAEKLKGTYTGHAPKAESGEKAVYIGSAVSYFPPQELGYHRPDGTSVAGIHALRDGVNELQGVQAEHIAKTALRNAEV